MFDSNPKARADLKAGALYAVQGEDGWIYFGQVTSGKTIGFFRRRARELLPASEILTSPVMSVVNVAYPSITRALRGGAWARMGHYGLVDALVPPRPVVQWPVGTVMVTIRVEDAPVLETRADDPAIQDMEIIAAWDAQLHVPSRLTADYGEEEAPWHVGGPVRRERRIREEMATRFPENAAHRLPADWVFTHAR